MPNARHPSNIEDTNTEMRWARGAIKNDSGLALQSFQNGLAVGLIATPPDSPPALTNSQTTHDLVKPRRSFVKLNNLGIFSFDRGSYVHLYRCDLQAELHVSSP